MQTGVLLVDFESSVGCDHVDGRRLEGKLLGKYELAVIYATCCVYMYIFSANGECCSHVAYLRTESSRDLCGNCEKRQL